MPASAAQPHTRGTGVIRRCRQGSAVGCWRVNHRVVRHPGFAAGRSLGAHGQNTRGLGMGYVVITWWPEGETAAMARVLQRVGGLTRTAARAELKAVAEGGMINLR